LRPSREVGLRRGGDDGRLVQCRAALAQSAEGPLPPEPSAAGSGSRWSFASLSSGLTLGAGTSFPLMDRVKPTTLPAASRTRR
jgi:hypothetical protein